MVDEPIDDHADRQSQLEFLDKPDTPLLHRLILQIRSAETTESVPGLLVTACACQCSGYQKTLACDTAGTAAARAGFASRITPTVPIMRLRRPNRATWTTLLKPDPHRLRVEHGNAGEVVHKRGGQNIRLLSDGSESAACLAATQLGGEDLRIHRLRPDHVGNRKRTRPVLFGGDGLNVHLVETGPLTFESLDQQARHQDVVATVLASRPRTNDMDLIKGQQLLEDGAGVEEGGDQNPGGLPTVSHGPSAVGCREDHRSPANRLRLVFLGRVAEVKPLDGKAVSLARQGALRRARTGRRCAGPLRSPGKE